MSANKVMKILNAIVLLGLLIVILLASIFQWIYHEIPCPLCLLQRLGLLMMCFGFLLNLRIGLKPSHYAFTLIAGLFTGMAAGCQVLMHITPGSTTFAQPLLGLGLYTWVFIITFLTILFCVLMLMVNQQFSDDYQDQSRQFLVKITGLLFVLAVLVLALNSVTTFLECGFEKCPSNPTSYKYLKRKMNENLLPHKSN